MGENVLVVFEVVAVAVVALHFAELHLLVVEVHPQLGLAEGELLSIGRVVAALPNTVKQHLVWNSFQKAKTTKDNRGYCPWQALH